MPRTAAHRSLVTVNGQIGEIKRGEFLQYTNFVFEVVSAVSSPEETCIQLRRWISVQNNNDLWCRKVSSLIIIYVYSYIATAVFSGVAL